METLATAGLALKPSDTFENRDPLKGDGNTPCGHTELPTAAFENRDPLKGDGNSQERLSILRAKSFITLKTETRLKGMETR